MHKVIYGCTVIVLIIGGWYWLAGPHTTPSLSKDLYPLYEALSWGPVQEKFVVDGPAVGIASEPVSDITNLAEHFQPFERYYDDVLTRAGWVRDDSRAAAGPGAEVTYYTKRDTFIIVSFSTVFHNQKTDAPAECPCDIQFFLTSGTQVGPTPAQEQRRLELGN